LYTANADEKLIYPLMFEDVNFSANERARGVKYVIAGYNWTMFRPGKDDYYASLEKLIKGLTERNLKGDAMTTPDESMSKLSLDDDKPPSYQEAMKEAVSLPQPNLQKAPAFFQHGMRLEAVDRKFPYFVCAAHVEDTKPNEGKIRIHFDGWTCKYDYWCEATALDLHPVGWCMTNGWEIQKPGSASGGHGFVWEDYLRNNGLRAATDDCFVQCQRDGPGSLHFREGMYLEVETLGVVHVAKVTGVDAAANGSIHVELEKDKSRMSFKKASPEIHPAMWASKNHKQLVHPFGGFRWSEFLGGEEKIPVPAFVFSSEQRSLPVGQHLPGAHLPPPMVQYNRFVPPMVNDDDDDTSPDTDTGTDTDDDDDIIVRDPFAMGGNRFPGGNLPAPPNRRPGEPVETIGGFRVNGKLEARDLKNPGLVCVATITDIRHRQLLIHFDGWTEYYDFWCQPDFKEIHPVGWCVLNGKPLQKPNHYPKAFSWEQYLEETGTEPVPVNAFTEQQRGGV
jgi:hypothetical protein